MPISVRIIGILVLLTHAVCFAQAAVDYPVVTMVPGQPVTFKLDEEHIVTFLIRERFLVLSSDAVLNDNTCRTTVRGVKAIYRVPMLTRSIVPVWLKHPTKQGLPLQEYYQDDNRMRIPSNTHRKSALSGDLFYSYLQNIPAENSSDEKMRQAFLADHTKLAWLGCKNCGKIFPKASQILIWDENFEDTDKEITMSKPDGGRTSLVNRISSRLEGVPFQVMPTGIMLSRPRQMYGYVQIFTPPGVSYQIQMNFQAQSLIDPDDQICQVKWDLNFTSLFTAYQRDEENARDPQRIELSKFKTYLYDPADAKDQELSGMFERTRWTSDKDQK